ncbi:DNA-binding response regulator [Xylanibacillus composti]|uniref:DNA-binding response regulator n=1 Tax=Xylanibacillus composti TaxID=1572762 RepID=A0A8J4M4J2_9BACL|nr:response regulator transcription factor [Xylanibacillus composti]MDT9724715.1 DNA-binding response regulator [Xylanibacillus composti]GIQ70716.1 DNA-binding response regulator [Xylanibacillus composti]
MGKPNESIRVFIVDDHDMVRLGLRTYMMIEDDIETVGEASNGKEAVSWVENCEEERQPDVILMDLMMPEMDGVEAARRIMEMRPHAKIVMLTSFLEDEKVVQAIEAGAHTYVLKTMASDELMKVIRSAAAGMPVMKPDVSQALTRGLRQRISQVPDELTAREKEVLLLIAEGKTNKDIAEELHISIKTVKTHVSNLLLKLELEDRTQLAIYAHRKGWA